MKTEQTTADAEAREAAWLSANKRMEYHAAIGSVKWGIFCEGWNAAKAFYEPEWTYCKDRLPDDVGDYEVSTKYTIEPGKHELAVYADYFNGEKFDDSYVYAWREQSDPAPYQSAETGGKTK